MRGEHAVVEDEIDPWPRRERRKLLEQRERLEDQVARAVCPGVLEREHDATVAQQPESILSHRRTEQIAAELFQPRAIRCRHRAVGVKIETRQMRVPRRRREHPRRVGIVPDVPYARPRERTECGSPLNRCAADAGERGRFFDNGIGLEYLRFAGIEAAALEQPLHAREHEAHLVIGRRGQRPEGERPLTRLAVEEDAVEEQSVEVVQIQAAAKALDDGH
jgi:hypothetical protein